MNVLPLVNKALAVYQWQQDLATSERLLKEALAIDPECDSAIATLAQLTLQQGKLDDAIELFDRHAKIARTEPELEQALTFKYVCPLKLQNRCFDSNAYPLTHHRLRLLSNSSWCSFPIWRPSLDRWPVLCKAHDLYARMLYLYRASITQPLALIHI